jgi:hypothetical protein
MRRTKISILTAQQLEEQAQQALQRAELIKQALLVGEA